MENVGLAQIQKFADDLYQRFRLQACELKSSQPIHSLSNDQAYDVQERFLQMRIADGEQRIGYKVGCTSSAIQQQFELTEPVYGYLMSPYFFSNKVELSWNKYTNCSVEPEFVLKIGSDITSEFLKTKNIIDAIEYISVGIEVHNYRFWYGKPTLQELIASNAFHACLIVGDDRNPPNDIDLNEEILELYVQDQCVARGLGSDILGGPLNLLRWLAQKLLSVNRLVKTGSYVIPGSPVRLISVAQGSKVKASASHFGIVETRFY